MTNTLQAPLPVAGWYDDPAGTQQLRWWGGLAWTEHVKAAERAATKVDEVSTTLSFGRAQGYVPFAAEKQQTVFNFRPRVTANTAAIWILASSPIVLVALQLFVSWMGPAQPTSLLLSVQLVQVALMLALIIWDRAALRRLSLTPCSRWWLLLPSPIVYLIVRRVNLKHQGVISHAPSNVFVLVLVASVGLAGLVVAVLLR